MKFYVITKNCRTDLYDRFAKSVEPHEVYAFEWELTKTGFTENFNTLLTYHMDNHPDELACICNDDIEFEDVGQFIERAEYATNKGAGIFSPIQCDITNPSRILMYEAAEAFPGGMHKGGNRGDVVKDEYKNVKWVPFAAPVLNPKMVKEIGILDKNFKTYFSDSDYCIRARLMGWPIIIDQLSVIRHVNHATLGQPSDSQAKRIDFLISQGLFAHKYGGAILAEYSERGN